MFDRLQARQIDRHSLAITSHKHTLQLLIIACIDLLMRHIGRHEDEIAGTRFGCKLERFAPPHAGASFQDEDDAFQVPVVVCAGFGARVDVHCACP